MILAGLESDIFSNQLSPILNLDLNLLESVRVMIREIAMIYDIYQGAKCTLFIFCD